MCANSPLRIIRQIFLTLLSVLVSQNCIAAQAPIRQDAAQQQVVRLKTTLDTGRIEIYALSPTSNLVALSQSDKTVQLWDAGSGKLQSVLTGFKRAPSLYWSPDGRKLLTFNWGRTVMVWNALTGEKLFALDNQQRDIEWLEWSPDAKTILTVTQDNSFKAGLLQKEKTELFLWDAESGRLKSRVTLKQLFATAKFSPDGQQLLTSGYNREAQLWDVSTGQLRATLIPPNSRIQSDGSKAEFLPGGELIVVSNFLRGLFLWEARSGQLRSQIIEQPSLDHLYSLNCVSPDGKLLVIYRERFKGGWSFKIISSIELRDSLTGELRAELTGRNMRFANDQMVWSSDVRLLATGGGSQGYEGKIWDVSSGQLKATFPMIARLGRMPLTSYYKDLDTLSFHPTRPLLMASSNHLVRFWNPADGQLLQSIEETGYNAQWTADGQLMLRVSKEQKSLQVWELSQK